MVSAELNIMANVTDNQARYRCEAQNSATEIPMFESKTLSVHCEYSTPLPRPNPASGSPEQNNQPPTAHKPVIHHFACVRLFRLPVPAENVKIRVEPDGLVPGVEAVLTCDSSSSNPPAKVSWWLDGIPVESFNESSQPGLWGGTVASLEFRVNVTQDMDGSVYTCQSHNEALKRSVHEAIALRVLCKWIHSAMTTLFGLSVH